MSIRYCLSYCREYGRCSYVLLALQRYRTQYGEPCPLENLAFAEQQIPPCFVAKDDRTPGVR